MVMNRFGIKESYEGIISKYEVDIFYDIGVNGGYECLRMIISDKFKRKL